MMGNGVIGSPLGFDPGSLGSSPSFLTSSLTFELFANAPAV